MIPVPKTKLDCLDEILAQAIGEMHFTGRTSVDFIKKQIARGYDMRCAGAYVDDLEDPTRVLLLSNSHGILTDEKIVVVHLIYVDPKDRGNKAALQLMLEMIEGYARLTGCDTIFASSWVYEKSKPCDRVWLRSGYSPQEVAYVKKLT
jgi:GNAT superfamily N-acetyltransferase